MKTEKARQELALCADLLSQRGFSVKNSRARRMSGVLAEFVLATTSDKAGSRFAWSAWICGPSATLVNGDLSEVAYSFYQGGSPAGSAYNLDKKRDAARFRQHFIDMLTILDAITGYEELIRLLKNGEIPPAFGWEKETKFNPIEIAASVCNAATVLDRSEDIQWSHEEIRKYTQSPDRETAEYAQMKAYYLDIDLRSIN